LFVFFPPPSLQDAVRKSEYHSNVAIVDLLPGGFEVVLEQSRPVSRPAQAQEQRSEEGEVGEGQPREHEIRNRWDSPIGTDASTWQPDFVDIREDRVVLQQGGAGTVFRLTFLQVIPKIQVILIWR
jgi:uncharacterized protein YfaS (alpha-2-macroglobulin family)